MPTFNDAIANLVTTLEGDSALSSFCNTKWGASLTVLRLYKNRTEIQISDLPIALVTRPEVDKNFLIGARDGKHRVRIYFGFLQEDRLKAQEELIEVEELIDDALLVDHTRGGKAIDTTPEASANDEGSYHPVYFMVMDVLIKHRR